MDSMTWTCPECGKNFTRHFPPCRREGPHFCSPSCQALWVNRERWARQPVATTTKVCSGCGQTKPLTEFWAKKRARSGTLSRCKDCSRRDYRQWQRNAQIPDGKRIKTFDDDPVKWFWSQVNTGSEETCWNWQGPRQPGWHGRLRFKGRMTSAHRVAWTLQNGAIPRGMYVCHHCDNPLCCNPSHLFLGTGRDNAADRHRKGRDARGEQNGHAKLTDQAVRVIRAELHESTEVLAKRFGVSTSTIHNVRNGRLWRHVTG